MKKSEIPETRVITPEIEEAARNGMAIAELQLVGLSVRTINALETNRCIYLKDLLLISDRELRKIKNLGDLAVKEVNIALSNFSDLKEKKVLKFTSRKFKQISARLENFQKSLNVSSYLR